MDSATYHSGPHGCPYPYTHPRSGSLGTGCPCQCRGAGNALHTESLGSRSCISGASRGRDRCQIILKDVGSGKGWVGDKTPELVLLIFAHEFDVNALLEVFHHFPEYRVIH